MAEVKKTTKTVEKKTIATKTAPKTVEKKEVAKPAVKKTTEPKETAPATKKVAPKVADQKIVKEETKKVAPEQKEINKEIKKAVMPKKINTAPKTLRVTLIRSAIGYNKKQARTLKALGLGKMNSHNDLVDNPAVRGMIFKVKHLVKVEDLKK